MMSLDMGVPTGAGLWISSGSPLRLPSMASASAKSTAGLLSGKQSQVQSQAQSQPQSQSQTQPQSHGPKRKRTNAKRACSGCRQHKLRCDAQFDPFRSCSRCQKQGLECIAEDVSRTDGRRRKTMDLERELESLRSALHQRMPEASTGSHVSISSASPETERPQYAGRTEPELVEQFDGHSLPEPSSEPDHHIGPEDMAAIEATMAAPVPTDRAHAGHVDAVSSLLSLGGHEVRPDITFNSGMKELDDIQLSSEVVQNLFDIYFAHYHTFLPLLDPKRSPNYYYDASKLLFWVVISVASRRYTEDLTLFSSLCTSVPRLLWSTLQRVPQNYHVVKALCIVCYWPFPISSSTADPTFMLAGIMKNLSLQCGLQRAPYVRDFSKVDVSPSQEEVKDRLHTWAACNIVAQSISIAYGQPSTLLKDWSLQQVFSPLFTGILSHEMLARLRIAMINNQVTESLYSNDFSPFGLCDPSNRHTLVNVLDSRLVSVETEFPGLSGITRLHLLCSRLHVRLCTLFDEVTIADNVLHLLNLYNLCKSVLMQAKDLDKEISFLEHCTNPLFQLLLAASFTIPTLLNSDFSRYIDRDDGRRLYNVAVTCIRKISVTNNDLPARLAEVLTQMLRRTNIINWAASDRIHLSVKCRMSVSVIYSCLWLWRDSVQARECLEPGIAKPTNPEFLQNAAERISRTVMYMSPESSTGATSPGMGAAPAEADESSYDPLNSLLDGLVVDFQT